MPISMSPSAHYKTQSSLWDNHLLGPLSNRRITHYAKLGRYGAGYKEQQRIAKAKTKPKINVLKEMLKGLI